LKILIYEDGKKVNIRYEKIAAIAEKYHIKQTFSTAEKIDAAMLQLIKSSIGEYSRGTAN
jgi:periplasmic protein